MSSVRHGADGASDAGITPVSRFRCIGCGYGAGCRIAPERCPVCAGSVWEHAAWRPFGDFLRDLDRPLTRATKL